MSDNNFNKNNLENQEFSNSDDLDLENVSQNNEDISSEMEQENALLKRRNQFNNWKTDKDDFENEDDLEDEDNFVYVDDSKNINEEDNEEDIIKQDDEIELIFDTVDNNGDKESFPTESESLYSKLIKKDIEDNNEEDIIIDDLLTNDENETEQEGENGKDEEEDFSIIDSLLNDADDIINEKEYIDINLNEEDVDENVEDNNYEESSYEDIKYSEDEYGNDDDYSHEDEIDNAEIDDEEIDDELIPKNDEEEFEGYYDKEELNKIRNGKDKKELIVKVVVGIGVLVVITMLALGVRYFLNKNLKANKDKKPNIGTEENITPTPKPSNTNKDENKGPTIIDDVIGDKKDDEINEPIIKDEEIVDNVDETDGLIDEEVSLFIQTYTGQILDINDDNVIVSYNLTYDKQKILDTDFTNYINSRFEKVWANEKEKAYHLSNDEEDNLVEMTLSQALDKEYILCNRCRENINIKNNPEIIRDYNYLNEENLINVQYNKFIYEGSNMIPNWVSIGSEVTITYIQNAESLLNEIIEISKVEKVVENNPDNKDGETVDEEILSTNLWGESFEKIVARINDRRENSPDDEGLKIEDTINLTLKENVSVDINIGKASIVWFQVAWKSNSVTKDIPGYEDVTVELVTSNGSLINDKNIDKYGKRWVDKGVTNFVIRDTKAGLWKVLFTKDTGTYLGDVMVQAVPITGFLQINKADAKYTDGKLHVIWEAKGIADDFCRVQIFARNGDKDVLIYAGNTLDDGIHTVDMVEIDSTKIAGNTYDIVIRITDIDVTASKPQKIKASYVTDEFIVKNVEIPKIK